MNTTEQKYNGTSEAMAARAKFIMIIIMLIYIDTFHVLDTVLRL